MKCMAIVGGNVPLMPGYGLPSEEAVVNALKWDSYFMVEWEDDEGGPTE